MNSRQRIFIGVPCFGDVSPKILEDWMRFMFHLGRRMPDYDFELGIKTKTEQFRARNAMVDGALQTNCDWLLMMDDDMIINPDVTNGPTEDYGFLQKLIAHDKDVCGIRYYQRSGDCAPVLMKAVGSGYRFLRDDEIEHRLQRVDVAGGGCLLVKTRVFDRIGQPYFEPEFRYGTDIQLCRKAIEKGFEVWADTSIEFGHERMERTVVTSRNRMQFQLTDAVPGEVKKQFVSTDIRARLLADASEYTKIDPLDVVWSKPDPFLEQRKIHNISDADWYRMFPAQRIARQVWFNTTSAEKKMMTEFVLGSVDSSKKVRILDFGCGIGIPAFTFAEKGHDVTAMDISGTGTFEFLKWRAARHGVPMKFIDSDGGVPQLGDEQFDVIVAMDCIEHIQDWRSVVKTLVAHLKPRGVLFANNAILEDDEHPEHYPISPREFIETCMDNGLTLFNQITYIKKAVEEPIHVRPTMEAVNA